MDFFFDWPIEYSLSAFLFVAIAASNIIYLVSHVAIKRSIEKSHERTGRVLFRTSASLLALLLSFTFANQRVNYYKIKDSLEQEASQLVDIWLDLQLYSTPEADAIQEQVKHYIRSILHEEIIKDADNPLFKRSAAIYLSLYNKIMNLDPANPKQEQLKQNLLADIDEVSDFMQVRGYRAKPEPLNLIFIATFGFVVSCILFAVYKPDKVSMLFFSLYNAFVSIVLYFIIMMNNPLIGPLKIQNEPFNMIIEIANLK
jgi:hypothetical protein